MRIRFDLFLTACYLTVSFCASAAGADDSWNNLKHVTPERYYTVVDRKSNCITGHIVKADDHGFTLKLPNQTSATVDRANVLRVSVSQAAPNFPPRVQADVGRVYDVIYNDKSSWSDLKGVAGQEKFGVPGQEVKVVKTDGTTYEGRLSTVSETQLELDRTGGKLEIAKRDVARVYHLRPKPLTDTEKYSAQEDFWIDPRLWPYYLHLVPRLPVRLYDSSLPEDNTPVRCENDSEEKSAELLTCYGGNVESIDLPSITIRQPNNQTKRLQWEKETSIRKSTKQTSIDEIKVGDQIVACGSLANGGFVAKRINLFK